MNSGRRVSTLVGAGLCKQAGLPTSVELAGNLRETLLMSESQCPGVNHGGLNPVESALHLATYRFLNGGIRFQQGILNREPDDAVNIEQLAVAAEALRNRQQNPASPYMSGWHERLAELERQSPEFLTKFVDFIYSQLDKWLSLNNERVARLSYIRNLVEICSDGVAVDLFSLNYDLCIEAALTIYAKKTFVNGFTAESGWQPELFTKDWAIRLYKLHGSLDWVEDQVYGVCSLQYPRHVEAETIEGGTSKPLLIFGTAQKLSPREPFLTLAYSFSKAILQTNVLSIIGYSFGDDYVNEIVRQGIHKNPKLRVLVVGPSAAQHVEKVEFLRNRAPRVVHLDLLAQEALTGGEYLNALRDMIEQSSTEDPFSATVAR